MTADLILPNAIVVDLSHWEIETKANFVQAKEQGNVVAVITKLVQNGVVDKQMMNHLYNAYEAGITALGIYDFGTASDDVQAYIADALKEFGGDVTKRLLALDAENNPSSQMTVADAEDWCSATHDKFGRWPDLYMGRSGPDGTGRGLPSVVLSNCDLWLPAYGNHANNLGSILPPGFRLPNSDLDRGGCLRLWQKTDGKINGGPIPGLGAVDQSVPIGFSSLDSFMSWWGT